jgi:tRNA pseudouridine32 synthase/23S rRNA pseudouridine746 synthase
MRHIGHPILGDELHGSDAAIAAATRLCLHACMLEFRHPSSGELVRVESTAPF